jgi:hypothetical protein
MEAAAGGGGGSREARVSSSSLDNRTTQRPITSAATATNRRQQQAHKTAGGRCPLLPPLLASSASALHALGATARMVRPSARCSPGVTDTATGSSPAGSNSLLSEDAMLEGRRMFARRGAERERGPGATPGD